MVAGSSTPDPNTGKLFFHRKSEENGTFEIYCLGIMVSRVAAR